MKALRLASTINVIVCNVCKAVRREAVCGSDCCRPLSVVVLLRHVAVLISLCDIICRLTAFIGCALNRTCFCAAHRTASCRRIGPRALRWLRRWAVVSTHADGKARGRVCRPSHARAHTQLLRYFSPRGRLNRNA